MAARRTGPGRSIPARNSRKAARASVFFVARLGCDASPAHVAFGGCYVTARQFFARRHPAARASASVQNQRSPLPVLIRVRP